MLLEPIYCGATRTKAVLRYGRFYYLFCGARVKVVDTSG